MAVGAEVPLQIANPQHQLGHGGGARVKLQPQKLVWVYGQALAFQAAGLLKSVVQHVQHFAFQAFDVLQRHIQKIARAAGGIKHGDMAQAIVKFVQQGHGVGGFVFVAQQQGSSADVFPVAAQRLNHGGQHQPFNVGARGVVGAQTVALVRVERALQQRAKDGGFDLRPVGAAGAHQGGDFIAVQRQRMRGFEQFAVKVQQFAAQGGAKTAGVHAAPDVFHHINKQFWGVLQAFQQFGKAALGQQAHVFGKKGKQAAGEKRGHFFGGVAGFQALGQLGQHVGNFTGGAGGLAGGVQRHGVKPQRTQPRLDFWASQPGQRDAVVLRIRERGMFGAAAGKFGVKLKRFTHIDNQQKRRTAFTVGRQGAGVVLGLAAGFFHFA